MKRILSGVLLVLLPGSALAQSGGGYNLEQNVIGSGGGRSDGGAFAVLGTMGQANAGSIATSDFFHLIDGFWAIENLATSAAFAKHSGHNLSPPARPYSMLVSLVACTSPRQGELLATPRNSSRKTVVREC